MWAVLTAELRLVGLGLVFCLVFSFFFFLDRAMQYTLVSEMTYYVSSGTLNSTNSTQCSTQDSTTKVRLYQIHWHNQSLTITTVSMTILNQSINNKVVLSKPSRHTNINIYHGVQFYVQSLYNNQPNNAFNTLQTHKNGKNADARVFWWASYSFINATVLLTCFDASLLLFRSFTKLQLKQFSKISFWETVLSGDKTTKEIHQ